MEMVTRKKRDLTEEEEKIIEEKIEKTHVKV